MNSELWEIHVQKYRVFNYSHDITLRKPNNTVNFISSLIIDSKTAQTISSDGINRIFFYLKLSKRKFCLNRVILIPWAIFKLSK